MIDSHCHINDELYVGYEEQYIKEAKEAGIYTFFNIGFNLESSIKAVEIANNYNEVFAIVGIHPSDVKKMNDNDLDEIEKLLSNNKVIGIGEIGLDFYWDKEEDVKQKQRDFFIKQIDLANKYDLPVSIHCREAQEECLNILKTHKVNRGGIIHCYAGSKEMLNDYRRLGFLIGVGGVVTFKNSVKLKEAVIAANDEDLVVETDAPYLAPVPFRGKPNHSKYIPHIITEIAFLRNDTFEHISQITDKNLRRVFKI